VQEERAYYYAKRRFAADHPDEMLTLIEDGFDQSKTPAFYKGGCPLSALMQTEMPTAHIVGVLTHGQPSLPVGGATKDHGFGSSLRYYACYDNICHGSNMVCEILRRHLVHVAKARLKHSADGRPLPRTMYLQVDGTTREHKNKYMMLFCAFLVYLGVFISIEVGPGRVLLPCDQGVKAPLLPVRNR